jgi:hypothetical protein
MPRLEEISYSRDACIAAVRGYYPFLTKLYLDDLQIVEPPAGGWPSISSDELQELDKTDEVIDLIRHLPYIRAPDNRGRQAQAAAYCYFANWANDSLIASGDEHSDDSESLRVSSEGSENYEAVPPHVIGLTSGGRDNQAFLPDTKLVVYWYECPGEIKSEPSREPIEDDPYNYAEEDETEWRAESGVWSVTDFFETLKDQFRELNFIPTSPWSVVDVFAHGLPNGMVNMLQGIYRQHGWPDLERYRKEDCMAAVRTALEENYLDSAAVMDYDSD